MHRIEHTIELDVPVHDCFEFVDDYRTTPDWMFGVSRFEPVGSQNRGLGTVVDIGLKLGPMSVKGAIEVAEWVQDERILIRMTKGPIGGTFSWTFEPAQAGGTVLTAAAEYSLIRGPVGAALAKVIDAILGTAIEHTERNLRDQLLASGRPSNTPHQELR